MPIEVHVGDIATLRKPHTKACGSHDWQVYRVGADIGLKCLSCGRRVMLPRRKFERALKKLTPPTTDEGDDTA
jgi:hypothetical protein